jgi:hypothetical protein
MPGLLRFHEERLVVARGPITTSKVYHPSIVQRLTL